MAGYKHYVSPALGFRQGQKAAKTDLGCHRSNKPSLQMSPMIKQPRPLQVPRTTRNVGPAQNANQVTTEPHGYRKARPVTGQGFIQTPLSSSHPVMIRPQMQSERQFGMDAELSAEKYQLFINKLHKSKVKWGRYRDVLTNDTCFNVDLLKEKYKIKEADLPSEQMTPSAASSGTKQSTEFVSQHQPLQPGALQK